MSHDHWHGGIPQVMSPDETRRLSPKPQRVQAPSPTRLLTRPVANNSFVTLPTPGTFKGTVDYGPSAGLQFAIEDSYHRVFQLSNDQKSGTVATSKPEVEHLTYTQESKTITLPRICFVAGSMARLD